MQLAASSGGDLGIALLPLIALVAAGVAVVAVGSLVVSWLSPPRDEVVPATVIPGEVGLLPVAFVSGAASNRWLPAMIVDLALSGAITIEDRRGAAGEGSAGDIRLVYRADLPAVHPLNGADETADLLIAVFAPGLTGGRDVVVHGASVPVDRVVSRNGRLVWETRRRFDAAARVYREPRPTGRFRAAIVGGVLAVVIGWLAVFVGEGEVEALGWIPMLVGAVALVGRALLPRWIPLNAAGLALRANAVRRREELETVDVRDAVTAEAVLPWAVLFDQRDLLARTTEALGVGDAAPAWYSSVDGYRADRVASCLELAATALVQPITVGSGSHDGRFAVPLTEQYWQTNLRTGYFWDNSRFGGAIYDGGGGFSGGFDGGSFDGGGFGGGFDGGGFDGGGFDGGGMDGGGQ